MLIFAVTVIIRIRHHDLSLPYHTLTIKIIVIIIILLTGNQYAFVYSLLVTISYMSHELSLI
jgi:hypothetical protein